MTKDWSKLYKKYKGSWVALGADEETVLGFGKTAKEALYAAKNSNSSESPILTRVPDSLAAYVGAL